MKKDSILKALGITFLVVVLLSWVIPAGSYSYGTYTASGSTNPIGLYDFLRVPVLTLINFLQCGLIFLAIGGFYGVLNQTGSYSNIVNNISKKWSKNKKKFLIITVILFSVLTSLTGLTDLMFILVPFFVAILLKLGYNKLTAFTSTVGSILVGNVGCTMGFNVWGYLKSYFSLNMTTLIFARIILLVMAVALLIIMLSKTTKETSKISTKEKDSKESKKTKESTKTKEVKEVKEEIPLFEDKKGKKSSLPLIILTALLFVLIAVGGYNWYYSFNIEFFNNIYENVSAFEIAGYPIINNLLALDNAPVLGYFQSYDITIILMIASLIIGWTYNVKIKDILSSFVKGAKEMLLPTIYAVLSYVVYACVLNVSGESFVSTIINKFIDSSSFSFLGTVGTSLVASFVYNDFSALLNVTVSLFTSNDSNVIPIIAFIIQGMFGIISLVAPTSVYLLAGLSYLDISYKEWIKHIWKYALILFGIIIVVAFILTTLI